MALKRKRSFGTVSSPSSETSESSQISVSMPQFYAQSKPIEALHSHKQSWSNFSYENDERSRHLNSRTRKRHRDNRPDEQDVFASTLNKLFHAQRQQPNASPVLSQPAHISPPPIQTQRSTLHSFWRIGQLPVSSAMALEPSRVAEAPRCDDCDGGLLHEDAMDRDDNMLREESSCRCCARCVCDSCAIVGDGRICLLCATQRNQ